MLVSDSSSFLIFTVCSRGRDQIYLAAQSRSNLLFLPRLLSFLLSFFSSPAFFPNSFPLLLPLLPRQCLDCTNYVQTAKLVALAILLPSFFLSFSLSLHPSRQTCSSHPSCRRRQLSDSIESEHAAAELRVATMHWWPGGWVGGWSGGGGECGFRLSPFEHS